MSNKAVKKLLQLREKELRRSEDSDDNQEVDDFNTKKPKKNAFNMLAVDEDGIPSTVKPKSSKKKKNKKPLSAPEVEVNSEEELQQQIDPEIDANEDDSDSQSASAAAKKSKAKEQSTQKSAKKSKSANKKAKNKKKPTKGEEAVDEDLQFLEQHLQKIGVSTPENEEVDALPETNRNAQTVVLTIKDPSKLNPDNELRKLFGARVMKATAAESSQQAYAHLTRGQQRALRSGAATRHHASLSSLLLVTPKLDLGHWPPYHNIGLSMSLDRTSPEEGLEYYSLRFNSDYEALEQHYALCVASHDPNSFVDLLARNPYHIASLLQLAEICRMQADNEQANELLDRALFALELSWHRHFSAAALSGRARLSARHRPNKLFYNTILMRLHNLARGGLHSTCIELCKLLFSLDPENDPARLLLLLDYFAIMSHQSEWLLTFLEEYIEPVNESLLYLPNLMFSKAIALFKQDNLGQAMEQLEEALLYWPLVVPEIVNSCKQANMRQWEPMIRNTFFTHTIIQSTTFNQLIKAYVARNVDVWNTPEMLMWLEQAVQNVLQRLQSSDDENEYAEKRRELFAFPAFAGYQNVTGAELSGQISPPMLSLDSDELVMSHLNAANGSGATGGGFTTNPLYLFFSGILPWNAAAPPPQ